MSSPVVQFVSVFDERTGSYSYYRVPAPPRKGWTMTSSPLGTPVRDALPRLPRGAVRVGRGPMPVGAVVQGLGEWRYTAAHYGFLGLALYAAGRLLGIVPPLGGLRGER